MARVGGFAQLAVAARVAPGATGGGLGGVQQIVGDLKGEPDLLPVITERRQLPRTDAPDAAPQSGRRPNQRARLSLVNLTQLLAGHVPPLGDQIQDLAAHHAARSCRFG